MEVTLPYLIFHSEPHFGHRDVWVGGRVIKGSGFCIYALLVFCASPFCDVQWLAGSPFYESCYTLQLTFSKFGPVLAIKLFVVLPNLWFEKLKLCPILLMLDWFHG